MSDADVTSEYQRIQAEFRVVEELERIREIRSRLEGELEATAEIEAASADLDPDTRDRLDPILRLLLGARVGMARHPTAAAAVFRALAAEGRRVADTPEGSARAAALAANPVMDDLRRIWETTSLNMLGDAVADPTGIPAGWLDLLLDAVVAGDTDRIIERLAPQRP